MIIEILAIILGLIAGIITGLLPGIHINLIATILLSLPLIASPIALVIFIVSMTISHTFFDFIPSIFLGCPDEDTSLSILPGHELLLQGKGYEAIVLSLYGCLVGIALALILSSLFILIFPLIYQYLRVVMFFLLISVNLYLLIKENKKLLALVIFLMSGVLGMLTINLPINNSLLPLLTGLFGSSSLISSIIKKEKLPKQKVTRPKIKLRDFVKPSLAGLFAAPLCSFLPALGTNQAAVIGTDIVEDSNKRNFLILIGLVNGMVICLSFVTLYALGEARTGSVVAVEKLLTNLSLSNLVIILLVVLTVSVAAFFLAQKTARVMATKIDKINYQYLSLGVLMFVILLVIVFSGLIGLLIFITGSAIGLVTISFGVRRTNMMASLMLPAIFFYLP